MDLEPASAETLQLLSSLVHQHHRQLEIMETRFSVLMAVDRDDVSGALLPCLKHHGAAALARVSIVAPRWRAHGVADVEIQIDAAAWEEREERQRSAILDHELTHLDVSLDQDGGPQWDHLGRPKLELRPHDLQFGWFLETARRWGADSVEVSQAREVYEGDGGQTLFPFVASARTPAGASPTPAPRWPETRLQRLAELVEAARPFVEAKASASSAVVLPLTRGGKRSGRREATA